MANLTDPLANPIHGTNPQNLIEYITRQKIYSTTFWKEECFGLSAQDIAAKAALRIKCVGGSYGGNSQPCRFLCMVLKMLQIGVENDILEEYLQNEDFKYVRLIGMFYLRLTGRPADIYQKMEPFFSDYRKARYRLSDHWEILHIDEFAHILLTQNEMCGITFPRLPKRENLQEAGYLDEGPRRSALGDEIDANKAIEMLTVLAREGSVQAKNALDKRSKARLKKENAQNTQRNFQQKQKSHSARNSIKSDHAHKSMLRSRSRSWGRNDNIHSSIRSQDEYAPHDEFFGRDHRRKERSKHSNHGYNLTSKTNREVLHNDQKSNYNTPMLGSKISKHGRRMVGGKATSDRSSNTSRSASTGKKENEESYGSLFKRESKDQNSNALVKQKK